MEDAPTTVRQADAPKTAFLPEPIEDGQPLRINQVLAKRFALHLVDKTAFKMHFLALNVDFVGSDSAWHYLIDAGDDNVYRIPISEITADEIKAMQLKKDLHIASLRFSAPRPIILRTEEFKKWRAELQLRNP